LTVLAPAHQGIVENNEELTQRVQAFLRERTFCSTKRLRREFNIPGSLAAVMLKACGFERYSRGVRNGINYRRKKKE